MILRFQLLFIERNLTNLTAFKRQNKSLCVKKPALAKNKNTSELELAM